MIDFILTALELYACYFITLGAVTALTIGAGCVLIHLGRPRRRRAF